MPLRVRWNDMLGVVRTRFSPAPQQKHRDDRQAQIRWTDVLRGHRLQGTKDRTLVLLALRPQQRRQPNRSALDQVREGGDRGQYEPALNQSRLRFIRAEASTAQGSQTAA